LKENSPVTSEPNPPNKPIIGFVAGTPLLTPEGVKPIEELRPGDLIETRPDDQDDEPEDVHDEDCNCPDHNSRWWEQK
jgi:hypothetical protein